MKLAVVIPDRGDRPIFLENCLRMLAVQTIKPSHIEIVNFKPENGKKDITKRYRLGYEKVSKLGFDLVAFIENDDWYAPNYLETMLAKWGELGRPDIIGTSRTIYYHIGVRKWFTMHHVTRSSAMSTVLKCGLDINWPADFEAYTDIALWHQIESGVIFDPAPPICVGIKHGVGLCGGVNHLTAMERYINDDQALQYLRELVDADSFNFYEKLTNEPI